MFFKQSFDENKKSEIFIGHFVGVISFFFVCDVDRVNVRGRK